MSLKTAQLFKEVRENSMRDPLTGCVMRAHASEVIDAELRRARRSQMPVSMILFDLDHFKQINDKFGHLCGDARACRRRPMHARRAAWVGFEMPVTVVRSFWSCFPRRRCTVRGASPKHFGARLPIARFSGPVTRSA